MISSQIIPQGKVRILNKKRVVVWFTGLPCSGKTTLSEQLSLLLRENNMPVYIIDGDQIRKGLN